jgi:hypothetical protein
MDYPFVVICKSVKMAEYMFAFLGQQVPNDDSRAQIEGFWHSLKQSGDDFCEHFSSDLNAHIHEENVLVCMSIIGSWFCMNTHFVSFQAIFTSNILCHKERASVLVLAALRDEPSHIPMLEVLFCQPGFLDGKPGGFVDKEDLRTSIQ